MKTFLRNYFVSFVALFTLAWLLPNVNLGYPVGTAFSWEAFIASAPIIIVASLILTLLIMVAKPIMKVIFIPINFITLGIFNTVINVFLIWLATYLVPGFTIGILEIGGMNFGVWGSMILFAICFSLIQSLLIVLF